MSVITVILNCVLQLFFVVWTLIVRLLIFLAHSLEHCPVCQELPIAVSSRLDTGTILPFHRAGPCDSVRPHGDTFFRLEPNAKLNLS